MRSICPLALLVLLSCAGAPEFEPVAEPGDPIVATFERLHELGGWEMGVERAFEESVQFRKAFDLRAAAVFPFLSEEYRLRIGDYNRFLKEPSGRLLMDQEVRLLFRIVRNAGDEEKVLRASSLKRLEEIFRMKGEDPDLRFLRPENGESETRDLLLHVIYRWIACAFSRAYDEVVEGGGRSSPALQNYCDLLTRLALLKNLKEGSRKILDRLSERVRTEPESLPEIKFEIEYEQINREAVVAKDRAVEEIARGGSPGVTFENFMHALAYFALLTETAPPEVRREHRPDLESVPLILNEIQAMILKRD
jgi:hypothetical protein